MAANTTPNRSYPLPDAGNKVNEDVQRLIDAFEAIDGDVAVLLAAVATKAAAAHGHAIEDIAGLATALNGKAAVAHNHTLAGLSDVSIAGAPAGRTLVTLPGGGIGIGPETDSITVESLVLNGPATGTGVQEDRNDVSWGGDLVRVDGAHAAVLHTYANYYSTGANRNIDEVSGGDVGLYSDSNPGTWPLAPAGRFWFVTTQRLYTNSAVVQRAFAYGLSNPDLTAFEYIRIRAGNGLWSSWRQVYHADTGGNLAATSGVFTTLTAAETIFAGSGTGGTYNGRVRLTQSDRYPSVGFMSGGTLRSVIASDMLTGAIFFDSIDSFRWRDGISGPELMRLTSSGLGIGKTATEKLDVAGTVNAAGFKINGVPLTTSAISQTYASPEQVITAGGTLSLDHGLAVTPSFVAVELVCKTADLGYSVGDVVPISPAVASTPITPTAGAYLGIGIALTDTTISCRYGDNSAVFHIMAKSSSGISAITPARWRLVVRAFA